MAPFLYTTFYLVSTSPLLYFTIALLDSTTLYYGSTWVHYTPPCLNFTLFPYTIFYHVCTCLLYYTVLCMSLVLYTAIPVFTSSIHFTMAPLINSNMAPFYATLLHSNMPWLHSTSLYYTLLFSTMDLLGTTSHYYTLIWLYLALIEHTILYYRSTCLYYTLPYVYFTVPCLFLALLDPTTLYHFPTWLYTCIGLVALNSPTPILPTNGQIVPFRLLNQKWFLRWTSYTISSFIVQCSFFEFAKNAALCRRGLGNTSEGGSVRKLWTT